MTYLYESRILIHFKAHFNSFLVLLKNVVIWWCLLANVGASLYLHSSIEKTQQTVIISLLNPVYLPIVVFILPKLEIFNSHTEIVSSQYDRLRCKNIKQYLYIKVIKMHLFLHLHEDIQLF